MPTLLHALRSALAFEQTLVGPHLPLDAPTPAAPERRSREASVAPPSPKPAPPDASPPASSTADAQTDSATPMANMDLFGNEIDPRDDPSRSPWERIAALIPDDSPLRAMETLEEVERYVNDTILVPIDEGRQNAVLGVGDPNADLVIIGEAPGADEDRTGEPFTGRAGQLLNKILAAINFKREEVYITNILKSRPPNNRDPLPAEVEAHIPILYKQLTLIKPKIILCVGKTAGNTMLDRRSSLGALRDKIHDFYGVPLIVTYHPAALLRNAQWKRPTWEDVKLLRTTYDKLVNA